MAFKLRIGKSIVLHIVQFLQISGIRSVFLSRFFCRQFGFFLCLNFSSTLQRNGYFNGIFSIGWLTIVRRRTNFRHLTKNPSTFRSQGFFYRININDFKIALIVDFKQNNQTSFVVLLF